MYELLQLGFTNVFSALSAYTSFLSCRMKEERLKKKSEGVSEVLAWVSKSRKLEEKLNAEKVKALHLSKVFEEQVSLSFMMYFLYYFSFCETSTCNIEEFLFILL